MYKTFIIDILKLPEAIDGIENSGLKHRFYLLSNTIKLIKGTIRLIYAEHEHLIKIKSFRFRVKTFKVVMIGGLKISFLLFFFLANFALAISYRLSIKSTFWFYLPLLFLVKSPDKFSTSKDIGSFLSCLCETKLAKFRYYFAITILIAFISANIPISGFDTDDFPKISWVLWLFSLIEGFYFKLSGIEIWKILQIIVASVSIWIYLYSDYVRTPIINNNIKFKKSLRVKSIHLANKLRNLCSFFYFSLAIIFLSHYLQVWDYKYMPTWVETFLNWSVRLVTYGFGRVDVE